MVMMILQDILLINITYREFNVLIDNKPVFDLPVKNKQKAYEKHWNLRNDGNDYKLISIDLSRRKNTTIPQQINFTGKFGEDDSATILNFYLDSLIVTE